MNATQHAVLFSLLDLAKNDRHATVLRVAEAAGLSRDQVVSCLAELDRAGLVDASRVRLSMMGLVIASSAKAPRVRRASDVAKKAA